jgi:GNAT superfamily N-acetyltransferase
MVIRDAIPDDAQDLLHLLLQLGYSLNEIEMHEKIRAYSLEGNKILVAESSEGLAAFISLHIFVCFHSPGSIGRITAFCVDEKHRSKGIGAQMLAEAENYFRKNNCYRVEVTSNNRRVAAHDFYRRKGYSENSKKFVLDL